MEPGFKNGKIILNNSVNSAYYPGQVIQGIIEFVLVQQQSFSSITAQYVGEAQVHWKEMSWKDRGQCNGREEYFNVIQTVFGGNGVQTLQSTTHRIPISFQVPFDIPPTFNGDKGCVWYRVMAHAERPARPRETIVKQFKVVNCVEISDDDIYKEPLELQLEGAYGGGCACAAGAVRVRARGPPALAAARAAPLELAVDNRSPYEVNYVVVTLLCTETYHSAHPPRSHTSHRSMVRERRGPVLSRSRREFTARLTPPAALPVDMARCRIIDVVYTLRVTVKMTGNNADLTAEREVTLGLPRPTAEPHPCRAELPPAPRPVAPSAPVDDSLPQVSADYPRTEQIGSPPRPPFSPPLAEDTGGPLDPCYADGEPSIGYSVNESPSAPLLKKQLKSLIVSSDM